MARENTNPARFPFSLQPRVETEKRVHCVTGREFYLAANSERRLSCGVSTKHSARAKSLHKTLCKYSITRGLIPCEYMPMPVFFTSSSGNICRMHSNFLIYIYKTLGVLL